MAAAIIAGPTIPANSYICFIALIGLRGMFLVPPILLRLALNRWR
jgi:hypothetical protein